MDEVVGSETFDGVVGEIEGFHLVTAVESRAFGEGVEGTIEVISADEGSCRGGVIVRRKQSVWYSSSGELDLVGGVLKGFGRGWFGKSGSLHWVGT